MSITQPTENPRYILRISRDLLEIDVLDLDAMHDELFHDIPDGGLIQMELVGAEWGGATSGRKSKSSAPKDTVTLCQIDRSQNIMAGPGLGAALERLLGPTGDVLILERGDNTGIDRPKGIGVRSQSKATPGAASACFRMYSPRQILGTGNGEPITASADSPGAAIRFDHAAAAAILQPLANLTSDCEHSAALHELGLQLSLRRGFDTLLSLQTLRNLSPFLHQIRTAERALRQMRGRALLCDEVGLGKTIEAGLILNEYRMRGLVRTALILTPSSLGEQWREEMIRKFDLPFVSHDSAEFKSTSNSWQTLPYIVASLETAKREPHRSQILAHAYDLVIVDEAHHLKNRNTQAWKFINQLKKKYILLLTATPVENSMDELFNLITLLRPGQLHTASEYKKKFVSHSDPLQPKNVDELKRLIQSVMIRNRRSTTGVIQAGRTAETITVTPSGEEAVLYARLSLFVKQQVAHHATHRAHVHPFVWKNLLRQAGSSGPCLVPTLRKMAEATGDTETEKNALSELMALAENGRTSEKMRHLAQLVAGQQQTVVFTGFIETQKAVATFLRESGIEVTEFHGGMTRSEKESSIERFRTGAPVLVSTESGGEGRNLQFCHRLVNFDIPWNPMRIEQRIGRIHRIGQDHEVNVYNLVARGTLEQHIVHILDAKINMFQLVVGELDMILGALDDSRDFEDWVWEVWRESGDDNQVALGMENLGNALVHAKEHYQKVQNIDNKLFTEMMADD